jgi:hypothetical protein
MPTRSANHTPPAPAAWEVHPGPSKASRFCPPAAAWAAVGAAFLCGLVVGSVGFSQGVPTGSIPPAPVGAAPVARPAGSVEAQGSDVSCQSEVSPPDVTQERRARAGAGAGGQEGQNAGPTRPKTRERAGRPGGLRALAASNGARGGTRPRGGSPRGQAQGRPLDKNAIGHTIGRYKASVSRSCWRPALDTRDDDAPTTARVSATLEILPSGKTRSAKTSGDPVGYPGLSRCIEQRLRGWKFPPSRDSMTVRVPFVFAVQ